MVPAFRELSPVGKTEKQVVVLPAEDEAFGSANEGQLNPQAISDLVVEPLFPTAFISSLHGLMSRPKLPTDSLKKIFIKTPFHQPLYALFWNLESSLDADPDLLHIHCGLLHGIQIHRWLFSPSGLYAKRCTHVLVRPLFRLAILSRTVGVGKWVYVLGNSYKIPK